MKKISKKVRNKQEATDKVRNDGQHKGYNLYLETANIEVIV